MTHLAWSQSPPRSHHPTRLFLVQYPSIILGLEVPSSKRLAAAHVLQVGAPVNATWSPGETGA